MNLKLAKKIRKANRRAGWEYVEMLCNYSFGQKLLFCKHILTHKGNR